MRYDGTNLVIRPMWEYIDDAAEARRRVGSDRSMGREEWLAHYACLRTVRARMPWYTGNIGRLFGVQLYRSSYDNAI